MTMWNEVKNRTRRALVERRLRKSIADSILSQNKLTVGNLNDYANLAMRLSDTDADAFQNWADESFTNEEGTVFDVVITTKDNADESADYVYNSDGGFAANFYKQ